MKCIILAAGYATRLYPLTKDKPKPLLEVKGKAILEHILDKVFELEAVNGIFLVTNAKFFNEFDLWAERFQSKIPVKIVNDHTNSNEDRLGAIGDLNYVIQEEKLVDDLLVVNADNLFNSSLKPMHDFFKANFRTVVGLYDVESLEYAKNFGVVEVDFSQRVTGFEEKPSQPKSSLISTGIYFYPRKVIELISGYLAEGNKADAPGHFLEWLYRREKVLAYVFKDKWFDIGSFEALGKAREEFEP